MDLLRRGVEPIRAMQQIRSVLAQTISLGGGDAIPMGFFYIKKSFWDFFAPAFDSLIDLQG
jgi:hypothetical protein